MSSDYDTLLKAEDARKFAQSRFGKHYIKRLKQLQADALGVSMNLEYTDSYRAHKATQASVLAQEIEYFRIAQTIQDNDTIMQKLRNRRDKIMGKEATPKV